jgi:hypothetical protein
MPITACRLRVTALVAILSMWPLWSAAAATPAPPLDDDAATEIGIVRSRWQAGAVREALAMAHLVSGEHPESMEALSWLVLIEDRLGQREAAMKRLSAARALHPQDPHLLLIAARIGRERDEHSPALGVIGEGGRKVLLPWPTPGSSASFDVWTSAGTHHRARLDHVDAASHLVVLRLSGDAVHEPASTELRWATFVPGRPAHLLLPPAQAVSATPPRPLMVSGLVTRSGAADSGTARFSASERLGCSPAWVVDDAGQIIGHHAAGTDETTARDALLFMTTRDTEGDTVPAASASRRLSAEEIYERLLPALVFVQPAR